MHSKKLNNYLLNYVEGIYIQLNVSKSEWLLFVCYHPSFQSDKKFFHHFKKNLDNLSQKYKKYILIGNTDGEDSEICFLNFLIEFYERKCSDRSKIYPENQM